MTDAIIRTLWRVYVTRRKLLEWVTAAQAQSGLDLSLVSFYRRMNGTVALAALVAILVALQPPEVWPIAAPFALLWALSPDGGLLDQPATARSCGSAALGRMTSVRCA